MVLLNLSLCVLLYPWKICYHIVYLNINNEFGKLTLTGAEVFLLAETRVGEKRGLFVSLV